VIQPAWMNSAVMKPHAMNAAMFGRIMLDKNVPNLCTCTRAPVRGVAVAVDAIEVPLFSQERDACHVSMRSVCTESGTLPSIRT
jgi:hypothetical protein